MASSKRSSSQREHDPYQDLQPTPSSATSLPPTVTSDQQHAIKLLMDEFFAQSLRPVSISNLALNVGNNFATFVSSADGSIPQETSLPSSPQDVIDTIHNILMTDTHRTYARVQASTAATSFFKYGLTERFMKGQFGSFEEIELIEYSPILGRTTFILDEVDLERKGIQAKFAKYRRKLYAIEQEMKKKGIYVDSVLRSLKSLSDPASQEEEEDSGEESIGSKRQRKEGEADPNSEKAMAERRKTYEKRYWRFKKDLEDHDAAKEERKRNNSSAAPVPVAATPVSFASSPSSLASASSSVRSSPIKPVASALHPVPSANKQSQPMEVEKVIIAPISVSDKQKQSKKSEEKPKPAKRSKTASEPDTPPPVAPHAAFLPPSETVQFSMQSNPNAASIPSSVKSSMKDSFASLPAAELLAHHDYAQGLQSALQGLPSSALPPMLPASYAALKNMPALPQSDTPRQTMTPTITRHEAVLSEPPPAALSANSSKAANVTKCFCCSRELHNGVEDIKIFIGPKTIERPDVQGMVGALRKQLNNDSIAPKVEDVICKICVLNFKKGRPFAIQDPIRPAVSSSSSSSAAAAGGGGGASASSSASSPSSSQAQLVGIFAGRTFILDNTKLEEEILSYGGCTALYSALKPAKNVVSTLLSSAHFLAHTASKPTCFMLLDDIASNHSRIMDAKKHNLPMITSKFISDSINAGKFLDYTKYFIEIPAILPPPQQARKPAAAPAPAPTPAPPVPARPSSSAAAASIPAPSAPAVVRPPLVQQQQQSLATPMPPPPPAPAVRIPPQQQQQSQQQSPAILMPPPAPSTPSPFANVTPRSSAPPPPAAAAAVATAVASSMPVLPLNPPTAIVDILPNGTPQVSAITPNTEFHLPSTHKIIYLASEADVVSASNLPTAVAFPVGGKVSQLLFFINQCVELKKKLKALIMARNPRPSSIQYTLYYDGADGTTKWTIVGDDDLYELPSGQLIRLHLL